MRLASLNPSLQWSPTATTYSHELTFDCPACGPPHRIYVACKLGAPSAPGPGVWALTLPDVPRGDGWDGVTLVPSIANHHHGRKKACSYHCSIVDGNVLP